MTNIVSSLYEEIANAGFSYPVYPSDYKGKITSIPYLKITILPGSVTRLDYNNNKKLIGQLIIQIYVKSGSGQTVSETVSNELDNVLKSLRVNDQTFLDLSITQPIGEDPKDETLFIYQYSIGFEYYGG